MNVEGCPPALWTLVAPPPIPTPPKDMAFCLLPWGKDPITGGVGDVH